MTGRDLWRLIHAMTKSEKRHFKLEHSAQGGSKNYLRLFDAIRKQDAYDEQAIKQRFSGEPFTRQLHVTRNYLYHLILKSLRNYHAGSNYLQEARQTLRNAEILFGKELFRQAGEVLDKAERVARKYEYHVLLCEILDLKRRLAQNKQPHAFDALQEIVDQQREAIGCVSNRNAYVDLIINVSRSVFTNEVEPVPREDWLEDPANALTLESKVMHYNARYFRQIQRNESVAAEQTFIELIDFLEAQPHRIKESPGLYVSSINNFVSYYVFNKEYEKALTLIRRGKSVYQEWTLRTGNRTLLKQILRTYTIELEVIRNHTLHTTPRETIDSIAEFVTGHVQKMPKVYLLLFWFQLAYVYYMRGDLKAAIRWVNEFIQTRHKRLRPDLQIHARMLNLMIQLDQDNQFVMRYFVDSTRRYIRKYGEIKSHEMVLLRFFSKMGRVGVLDRKDAYRALRKELFPEAESSHIPEDALGYIDYKTWLDQRC